MEKYEERAKELLKKAIISEPWKNPKNKTAYVLMVDREIIGHISKEVDPSKLTIGDIHEIWRGRKAELMYVGLRHSTTIALDEITAANIEHYLEVAEGK